MRIVVVNGMPCSGKTTFENFALEYLGEYGKIVSTIDFVKEIAEKCGWDGTKTPENRKFLSDLKDLLTQWDDVPFKQIEHAAALWKADFDSYDMPSDNAIMFVDSREPAEIERFKQELGAITMLVRRPEVETTEQSNHADSEVFNYKYDLVVVNDGTLDALKNQAEVVIKYIKEM